MGAFPDLGAGAGLSNFFKKQDVGAATKKLLKIFLFIFSIYIFTIKIFLKNTLLCLDSQNKERRWQETQNKTQNKKENTKEATNIQNKIEEGQIQDV